MWYAQNVLPCFSMQNSNHEYKVLMFIITKPGASSLRLGENRISNHAHIMNVVMNSHGLC